MAAARDRRGLGVGGKLAALALAVLLSGVACEGTERAIFEPLPQVVVGPPKPPALDAGSGHHVSPPDAGRPPVMSSDDAGEDDAGSLDPDLNPNVTFVWTETLPGKGTCRAGVYSGSFDCQFPDALAGLPITVTGQIAFTLAGSPEKQSLSISDGSLTGSGGLLTSGLSGTLDCIANHFQGAALDGQAVSLDPNNPFALTFPTFNASLQGNYDDQALVIAGTFTLVNDAGDMCSGTFRVSAAP
jgi:hypothetical protein